MLDHRVLMVNDTPIVLNCEDALTASLADMLGYKQGEVNQIWLGEQPKSVHCEICGDELFDLDGTETPHGYYCPFCYEDVSNV